MRTGAHFIGMGVGWDRGSWCGGILIVGVRVRMCGCQCWVAIDVKDLLGHPPFNWSMNYTDNHNMNISCLHIGARK